MTTDRAPDGRGGAGAPSAQQLLVDQPFAESDLPALRRTVAAHADLAGVPSARAGDLILVVSELASNAIRHGGGSGRLRLWLGPETVTCEISDDGPGPPPRQELPQQRPHPTALGGRGLWLVHTFAERFDLERDPDGGAVARAVLGLSAPGSQT